MNIFASNPCPILSAQEHCNIHLVKMVTESCQLLSTAHFILDGKHVGMKPTHVNHPAAIWTRENKSNYQWLYEHYVALSNEYTHRTGKVHQSSLHMQSLLNPPSNSTSNSLSLHPMCMPNEHKTTSCIHTNYQLYLNSKFKDWTTRIDKRKMKVEWTNRKSPEWVSF